MKTSECYLLQTPHFIFRHNPGKLPMGDTTLLLFTIEGTDRFSIHHRAHLVQYRAHPTLARLSFQNPSNRLAYLLLPKVKL